MIKEINSEDLKKIIKKEKKVLVDCYADWCGPCKMLSPILEQLAEEVKDISFYKINIDEDEDISEEYGINSIPNLLFFIDGKLKDQIVGLRGKDELLSLISK